MVLKVFIFIKKTNKWQVEIQINNVNFYIGSFKNIDDAIQARRIKAKELYGEFLNDCEK